MISNSDIKAAWVAKLKANTNITNLVPAAEIREVEWKGTNFTYPNIRVQLHPLIPTNTNANCQVFGSRVSILIYTEQKSSKQADDIAVVVAQEYWGHVFSSLNIRFSGIVLQSLDPAIVPEEDANSWRSAVQLSTVVQHS